MDHDKGVLDGLEDLQQLAVVQHQRGARVALIYGAIRDAVTELRLPPSTKLSDDRIDGAFNVSQTIVGSALQALAPDPIVTIARNRDAFVADAGGRMRAPSAHRGQP